MKQRSENVRNVTRDERDIMMDLCDKMRTESTALKSGLKYSFTTLFSTFRMKRLATTFDKQLNNIERLISNGHNKMENKQIDTLVGNAYKTLDSLKSIADKSKSVQRQGLVDSLHQTMKKTIIETPLLSSLDLVKKIGGATLQGKKIEYDQKQEHKKADEFSIKMSAVRPAQELLTREGASMTTQLSNLHSNNQTKIIAVQKEISTIDTQINNKKSKQRELRQTIQSLTEQATYAEMPSGVSRKVKVDNSAMGGSSSRHHGGPDYETIHEMTPDLEKRQNAKESLSSTTIKLTQLEQAIKSLEDKKQELNNKSAQLKEKGSKLSTSCEWIQALQQAEVVKLYEQLPSEKKEGRFYQKIATILSLQLENEQDPSSTLKLLMAADPSPSAVKEVNKYLNKKEQASLTKILRADAYSVLTSEANVSSTKPPTTTRISQVNLDAPTTVNQQPSGPRQ